MYFVKSSEGFLLNLSNVRKIEMCLFTSELWDIRFIYVNGNYDLVRFDSKEKAEEAYKNLNHWLSQPEKESNIFIFK